MFRFLMAIAVVQAVVLGTLEVSKAQESVQIDEAREAEISQRAKKRLYPGGPDEQDLKVQAELVTPTRKMAPQAEVKDEDTSEE